MPTCEPPKLEWAEDGSLVITKDRPSPVDVSRLLGGVWLPIFAGINIVAIAIPVGLARPWIGAVLAILGVAFPPLPARAAWRRSQHIEFAAWRLDDAGIEYLPVGGDRRRLAWDEVCRVRWGRAGGFRLVGPGDEAIGMPQDGIADADWRKVRDRVEAALSPRFDLAIDHHPGKFRLGRILLITLVLAMGGVGLAWALPHLTIFQLNLIVAALAAIFVSGWIAIFARISAMERRDRPEWRYPRSERVNEDTRV